VQRAKTVRHPLIVRYIDVVATLNTVSIITERVIPLEEAIKDGLTVENLLLGLSSILVRPRMDVTFGQTIEWQPLFFRIRLLLTFFTQSAAFSITAWAYRQYMWAKKVSFTDIPLLFPPLSYPASVRSNLEARGPGILHAN